MYASGSVGATISSFTDSWIPIGADAGFVASRDVDRVVASAYAANEADVAVVLVGRFDVDRIAAATKTKTGGAMVRGIYAGFTTTTAGALTIAPLTSRTLVTGTNERVHRVLDRVQQGKLERSMPPWAIATLDSAGAQFAIAADFSTQPIASATLGSINLAWLKGLKVVRAIGDFDSPGVNVAATLTYADESGAAAAADGMRLIGGWQKLLAPLLFGAKLQNLQAGAQRHGCLVQVRGRRRVLARAAGARDSVRPPGFSMTTLVVHPADKPLTGSVPVPSDKSIGHRALLLGALGHGETRVAGFSRGEGVSSTARCLRAIGVTVREVGPAELVVVGAGLDGLRAPEGALDCGGSRTTLRLLCSVLGAQPFQTRLEGDPALSRLPVMRVAAPLRARGAVVDGRPHPTNEGEITAPLLVGPLLEGRRLAGLEYESPVPSAEVKSVVLLSGLFAEGVTIFKEPTVSPDHTERMLDALERPDSNGRAHRAARPRGVGRPDTRLRDRRSPAISRRRRSCSSRRRSWPALASPRGASASTRRARGSSRSGATWAPGSPSNRRAREAANRWPRCTPGARRCARSRSAARRSRAPSTRSRSPARWPLERRGRRAITGAEELRLDGGDRIGATVRLLRAFGVGCEERPDGLDIEGRERPLEPADVDSGGDPRIAMTAAVLALVARAPCRVRDAGCIATRLPEVRRHPSGPRRAHRRPVVDQTRRAACSRDGVL